MKLPRTELKKARIEIIPMIDTIFFLLVFFMITSLSMIRMKAMPVALPKTASAENASGANRPHTLILTVTEAGGYYVNTTHVTPDTLGDALQSKVNTDPRAVVVLNFAKTQTAQNLIRVLDIVNKIRTPDGSGVTALMATEPVDKYGRALSTTVTDAGGKS